ncbi:hypothetical protein QBC46DRAFT_270540 [Diplogelasinospora grovesii]|uniref:Pyridine nucleotide-disulfide oxidoreductase family protein n=1 Tax=Diplogelasinospora grovesii TaxID=303347 RepID=A0AAN6MYQ0_9PEZI|nr:hypothetical protein QBC46DRAFT_270540 [Diplogelasinospora grovesii]
MESPQLSQQQPQLPSLLQQQPQRDYGEIYVGPKCFVQTAENRRYNLYFAAYQDKIHVFQPKKPPNILPPPSLILHPKKSKAAKLTPGALNNLFGHQINQMMVGDLGNLEVVYFAFDDGDVSAYYTHAIAQCILSNGEHRHRHKSEAGGAPRMEVPKQFFHENVGTSAWGLAIHAQSRLLAVSSNYREVTVFAFSMNQDKRRKNQKKRGASQDYAPPHQTALELEKHFQSRTRTWRIVLPLGQEGHNIPSIAFADDENGYADKVVAVDIPGNIWILDIWKIGASPIVYPPGPRIIENRQSGWGVLVLDDSHFKPTKSIRESLGLPRKEIQPYGGAGGASTDPDMWLDTTCSLYYVKDLAPNPESYIRARHGNQYHKLHQDRRYGPLSAPAVDSDDEQPYDDTDSDTAEQPRSSGKGGGADDGNTKRDNTQTNDYRWHMLRKPLDNLKGTAIDDLDQDVHLSRTIVPSFGQTHVLDGTARLLQFEKQSSERRYHTRSIGFNKVEFPRHAAKNLSILRTTQTDIELQNFGHKSANVVCKSVLGHHNHHRRRVEPYDMARIVSERVSMVLHVPELNLVVAGSLTGRVALITLTRTARRVVDRLAPLRRGFRVDAVLPRKNEEDRRLRPWCALHGIAISPVPDEHVENRLELRSRHPRQSLSPKRYRLILHYMDHTILMYEIARRPDEEEDLMIF